MLVAMISLIALLAKAIMFSYQFLESIRYVVELFGKHGSSILRFGSRCRTGCGASDTNRCCSSLLRSLIRYDLLLSFSLGLSALLNLLIKVVV
jgi:hypothetical protein